MGKLAIGFFVLSILTGGGTPSGLLMVLSISFSIAFIVRKVRGK